MLNNLNFPVKNAERIWLKTLGSYEIFLDSYVSLNLIAHPAQTG